MKCVVAAMVVFCTAMAAEKNQKKDQPKPPSALDRYIDEASQPHSPNSPLPDSGSLWSPAARYRATGCLGNEAGMPRRYIDPAPTVVSADPSFDSSRPPWRCKTRPSPRQRSSFNESSANSSCVDHRLLLTRHLRPKSPAVGWIPHQH